MTLSAHAFSLKQRRRSSQETAFQDTWSCASLVGRVVLLFAACSPALNSQLMLLYSPPCTLVITTSFSIERPMKIEIVVDPSRPAPAASLVSRVAPAATEGAPARSVRLSSFHGPISLDLGDTNLHAVFPNAEAGQGPEEDVAVEGRGPNGLPRPLLTSTQKWRFVIVAQTNSAPR